MKLEMRIITTELAAESSAPAINLDDLRSEIELAHPDKEADRTWIDIRQ